MLPPCTSDFQPKATSDFTGALNFHLFMYELCRAEGKNRKRLEGGMRGETREILQRFLLSPGRDEQAEVACVS